MPFDPLALFVSLPVVILTVTFVIALRRSTEGHPESLTVRELDEAFELYTRTTWVLTLLLVVLFTATGVQIATKLFEIGPLSAVVERFGEWGYSTTFRQFIGATEVLAAMLLLFPRTARWGAGYLAIVMAGSIYTHLAYGSYALAVVPFVLLIALVFLGYEHHLWSKKRRAKAGETDEGGEAHPPLEPQP